jgi:DNA-directed RNA polymerase sigma subunit (sigma70/sigma32)
MEILDKQQELLDILPEKIIREREIQDDGSSPTLEKPERDFNAIGERIRQIEAEARRLNHHKSRHRLKELKDYLKD